MEANDWCSTVIFYGGDWDCENVDVRVVLTILLYVITTYLGSSRPGIQSHVTLVSNQTMK